MAQNALALSDRNSLPAAAEWETMLHMSEVLLRSGMLPAHIKTAAAAVALVQKGRELGVPPMYALSNIAVIQGKPTANAELMLALIYRDQGDGAIVFAQSTNEACEIAYKRRSWPQAMRYSFTKEDAVKAGLWDTATWKKYPAAMLRARCISAVARMAFPDSIGGMYTPEELGAEVDEDGVPVMATHDPVPLRELPPQRPAAPPPSTLPQTRNKVRVAAEVPEGATGVTVTLVDPDRTQKAHLVAEEPDERPALLKKLWALAVAYYGDRDTADTALHEWIGVGYPEATKDGKPSLRALTAGQMREIIDAIEAAPEEAEVIEPEEAHLRAIAAE